MAGNAPTCHCGVTAQLHQVKKEGPSKGRHFLGCARHVCEFFRAVGTPDDPTIREPNVVLSRDVQCGVPSQVRDQVEMELMKERLKRQEEELQKQEEVLRQKDAALNQAQARTEGMVSQMIQESRSMIEHQSQTYATEVQTLRDQMLWMSCVAGEERMQRATQDPEFYQETVQQAMEVKRAMEEAKKGAQ